MSGDVNLQKQMVSGLKWVTVSQVFIYFIQFGVSVIIARCLDPNNFGALSATLVFTNLFIVFNELGMVTAVIQKKELTRQHKVTALWVCVTMGLCFLVFVYFAAPQVAAFFKNADVGSLAMVFAVKFLVDSFGMVHEALLRKELLFKKLASIDIWTNVVYALACAGMIFKGLGIVSVGWGYLVSSLLRVVMLWRTSHFGPYAGFDMRSFRELFGFGKNIVGFKIVNYVTGNIDVALIGKFLGTVSLGYYALASSLANFPRLKLCTIISNVFFPAFSKLQDDPVRVKEVYLKIVRYAAIINFPLLVGLMVLAPQFVELVYSAKWGPMVLPLRFLCVYGLLFSITTFSGIVYNAMGRPGYSFKFVLMNFAGTVLAIALGFRFGLAGIACALSVSAFVLMFLAQGLVKKIIHLSFRAYIQSMVPAAASTAVMAAWLLILSGLHGAMPRAHAAWFLPAAFFSSVFIYGLSLYWLSRKTFFGLIEIGHKLVSGGAAS